MKKVSVESIGGQRVLGCQTGSAVIFALFACLVASIAIQMLTAAVICGRHAIVEETVGRKLLAGRDACLVELMEQAGTDWRPSEIGPLEVGGRRLPVLLAAADEDNEWVLSAQVSEEAGSTFIRTSALVERGRDGLDLPVAALVADRVRSDPTRVEPWLAVAEGTACVYAREFQGSSAVGQGCVLASPESTWILGQGWRNLLAESDAWDDDCIIMLGQAGLVVRVPKETGDTSRDDPLLVVVLGGASLDLRGLGEVWATVVVDEGSLLMEGTVVHGSVCVTGSVDLGTSGQVVYESGVLQWARDRSLTRTRLVPGSRREVTE